MTKNPVAPMASRTPKKYPLRSQRCLSPEAIQPELPHPGDVTRNITPTETDSLGFAENMDSQANQSPVRNATPQLPVVNPTPRTFDDTLLPQPSVGNLPMLDGAMALEALRALLGQIPKLPPDYFLNSKVVITRIRQHSLNKWNKFFNYKAHQLTNE